MRNIINLHNPIKDIHLEEGAILLIDKPLTWTSFDVVNKIRYAIRAKLQVKRYKVGHAGTLDPLATGLLIICIGKYTKLAESIVATKKGYDAEIQLGANTPSYDNETLPHIYYPRKSVNQEDIRKVEVYFSGDQEQLPPMFSAVKVNGVPLYRMARKGEEIERKSRKIQIHTLIIEQTEKLRLNARIICSKGTYIRTLAHDIGKFLKTGGYLSTLRRTQVGDYRVEDALSIEEIVTQIDNLKN